MRAAYDDLPVTLSGPGFESREGLWGGLVTAWQSCDVPVDTTEMMKALPGGTCPCSHWGVVTRGEARFRWDGRETVLRAGDAYHAEPGHTFSAAAGTQLVEFTPAEEHRSLMAALADVV